MKYQFSYRTVGNPGHPCILFLHGFMGNVEEFTDVINYLKTDFFCLSLDLPGHGKTHLIDHPSQHEIVAQQQTIIKKKPKLKPQTTINLVSQSTLAHGTRGALGMAEETPNYLFPHQYQI